MKFSRNRFLQFDFQIAHLSHSLAATASKCQYIILHRKSRRTRPPVTANGSATAKWAEVQRWQTQTSKTQSAKLSSQRNFLLVSVADSVLMLHIPVPVTQGRLRPAEYIIVLNTSRPI